MRWYFFPKNNGPVIWSQLADPQIILLLIYKKGKLILIASSPNKILKCLKAKLALLKRSVERIISRAINKAQGLAVTQSLNKTAGSFRKMRPCFLKKNVYIFDSCPMSSFKF